MRACTLNSFDAPPVLRDDVPEPTPADGEVLVRVRASSVNPVDNALAAGMLSGMLEHEFPIVLGRDYAGVVEGTGSAVTRYATGDEVYGFLPLANPTVHDGSWTELITVPEDDSIARAPEGVDIASAGAAALAGITAMLAVDALELSSGATVVIVGATGGVGSFAVQLAVHAGATVLAPALAQDDGYLHGLGVGELLDRDADVAAAVRERHPDGVDALLDLVSYAPDGFEAHAAALTAGGRGASSLGAAGDGAGRANIVSTASTENLERLGRLLADGTVEVPIQHTHELAQAADALQAVATSHKQGKHALRVD
jgi:NADPH2:quinone reductase